jgi:hypothetical protein
MLGAIEAVIAIAKGAIDLGRTGAGWVRRKPTAPRADSERVRQAAPEVADFATGLRQAVMAVRAAVEHFDLYGVLVDADTGAVEDLGAELLVEARRTTEEAEARLPRVQLSLGSRASEGAKAVDKLRQSVNHVRNYIQQPGEGEDWSLEEIEAAKASLQGAIEHERTFVSKARN